VYAPDKGEVLSEGDVVNFATPREARARGIATVFQCLATVPRKMGIDVRDPDQTVGTLSGGERQAMAIARAVYFGAKVPILDEPTAALGVRQSGIVLKYVIQARSMGRAVIFITHNPHHAYPVGDRFVLLKRGRMFGSYAKSETSIAEEFAAEAADANAPS